MLKGICVRMKCVLSDGKMRAFSVIKCVFICIYTLRVCIQNGISLTLISTNSVRPIHITACMQHLTHYYSVVYANPLERYPCHIRSDRESVGPEIVKASIEPCGVVVPTTIWQKCDLHTRMFTRNNYGM